MPPPLSLSAAVLSETVLLVKFRVPLELKMPPAVLAVLPDMEQNLRQDLQARPPKG